MNHSEGDGWSYSTGQVLLHQLFHFDESHFLETLAQLEEFFLSLLDQGLNDHVWLFQHPSYVVQEL